MNLKTRSLRANLLIYFLIYSALILCFLYIFQILFLNNYYKIVQADNLNNTTSLIEKSYKNNNTDSLDKISLENDVCIQIIKDKKIVYSSNYVKHCMGINNNAIEKIKSDFFESNKTSIKVEFVNNNFHNKSLIYGKKIAKNTIIFANTSLQPIDKSIGLLKHQFKYVFFSVLVLSFIISYLFANRLSNPIIKINKYAKKIAKKQYKNKLNLNTEIAELKELEVTLNYTVKELEKADKTQNEFLANVGHDLKTPLTMIEAYASSAKDLNYNNKKKREGDLEIIINEAERLNSLVNDILWLTKIKSSITKPKKEKFNITEFISSILERFKIYEKEGFSFVFDNEKDYIISADKKLLERAIYNLIINAINYTGNDKRIIISLIKEDYYLKVCVSDTGKGIDEKDKKNVWNKYFTTNKRYHRNERGTGLGLSIVKEVFTSHGFEYGIDNRKKKGTTFYFKTKIEK